MMTLLYEAMTEYGMAEVRGKDHNPRILELSKEAGFDFDTDETSWCGIFMAAMAKRSGLTYPEKAYSARSWLDWGESVSVPKTGDIVVYWRNKKDSWQGHVGIFIAYADGNQKSIFTLGGNQSNMVCVKPYDASRVLDFRRL